MLPFYRRSETKADGRSLLIYGTQLPQLPQQKGISPVQGDRHSHLRWHPLRQEWVCYAAHRQDRTFKPPESYCPLCPSNNGGVLTEIPFQTFEVAVFENRFAAFSLQDAPVLDLPIPHKPAIGRCEVMVYSATHNASLGAFSPAHLELIVQVWRDRYQDLLAHPEIQFVMPFENRGEEVGVTLSHPHGQIYAFADVPPVVGKMLEAFREKPVLQDLRQTFGEQYDVATAGDVVAFVPPFARYPFEVWVTTQQFHPGLWTFAESEVRSLAHLLGKTARLYDHLFGRPMPYIMVLYAAPKGAEDCFQFHIQFFPFLRAAEKLKYLAGCETGAGTFLADMLPEEMVKRLREVVQDDEF